MKGLGNFPISKGVLRHKRNLHALVTSACRLTTEPFPEMATQAQWNSEKYSSTCSRSISTEASVYLTPDSGSTWSSFWLGSTFSELHWKKTLKAWATRQCKVAGLDLIRKVSEGSLRKMGSAKRVGSPDGRTSGSNFLVWSTPNGGISDVDLTLSCSCVISLRSSGKYKKMVSVFYYHHPWCFNGVPDQINRSIISFPPIVFNRHLIEAKRGKKTAWMAVEGQEESPTESQRVFERVRMCINAW